LQEGEDLQAEKTNADEPGHGGVPAGDANIVDQKEIPGNMEVHHHPQLPHGEHSKKFKEYFLEFLMIFLAVSMGFIAENIREHISDGEKEKQYIESFIADVKGDTAACARSVSKILLQVYKIDTLESVLSSIRSNNDTSAIIKCYNLAQFIESEYSVSFSERTINQLISSGNMRLLQNSVSDSVMDYFTALKAFDGQKQFYINYTGRCIDEQKNYFQFRYIHTTFGKDTSLYLVAAKQGNPILLTTDSVKLGSFNSTIEFTKRIAYGYMLDLLEVKKKATGLLVFLQSKYGLRD
jgi:hypothetical protein